MLNKLRISLPIKYAWKENGEIPTFDENDYYDKQNSLNDSLEILNTNETSEFKYGKLYRYYWRHSCIYIIF